MNSTQFCIVFVLLGVCSAFFKIERDEDGLIKWNGLRVTWGRQVSGKNFDPLPRTISDAREQGYVKSSDCHDNAKWRGIRYTLKDYPYVIPLFDVNGYIAGIQTTAPKNANSTYPSEVVMPPFEEDGDMYVLSVYFVDPARICTSGRTEKEFSEEGTGTNLYIQFGSDPESDYMIAPRYENGTSNTLWQKGGYIETMGQHFWYNLSVDMRCDELMPYFLMYNEDQLTGFGFAFPMRHPSPRYERPTPTVQTVSMGISPKCMMSLEAASSLHVFLTDIDVQTGAGHSADFKAGYHVQVVSCAVTLLMAFAMSF